MIGNPGDIVGPILAPHQAGETWQGKIAAVLRGEPTVQEGGRPWMLIDTRDVALAEILLAESNNIESGERFLLSSGVSTQTIPHPLRVVRVRVQIIRHARTHSAGK